MDTRQQARARDLMQTEVITLLDSAPIREAVQTFEECNIKGAPVVDVVGKLVGVITASDLAKTDHLEGDRFTEERGSFYTTDSNDDLGPDGSRRSEEFLGKEDFSPEVAGSETVGDWMTPRVISVSPDDTISQVCKTMSDEGVHRVMVVYNSKILGIISAMDIVRMVAEGR